MQSFVRLQVVPTHVPLQSGQLEAPQDLSGSGIGNGRMVVEKHKDPPHTNWVVQLVPHFHELCKLGGSILVESSTQGKIGSVLIPTHLPLFRSLAGTGPKSQGHCRKSDITDESLMPSVDSFIG